MKVLWYLEFITDANTVILKQVNGEFPAGPLPHNMHKN